MLLPAIPNRGSCLGSLILPPTYTHTHMPWHAAGSIYLRFPCRVACLEDKSRPASVLLRGEGKWLLRTRCPAAVTHRPARKNTRHLDLCAPVSLAARDTQTRHTFMEKVTVYFFVFPARLSRGEDSISVPIG